jgi:hypothetical protein
MLSETSQKSAVVPCVREVWLGLSIVLLGLLAGHLTPKLGAQTAHTAPAPAPLNSSSYQGSVPTGEVSAQPLDLTLDEAIQRGLLYNLGTILSTTQASGVRGQRLSQMQSLLPTVDASWKWSLQQVDLAALGLRVPGFPSIVGPFGYTDLRASLSWAVVDVNSIRNYLAARHNFNAAQLTAEDARQVVVLSVGNAYLLVLADESLVTAAASQVATSKVSLDQAVNMHQAGTAPLLDELRARVDYQTLQQQLIVDQNALEKDRLALARTIGLPLAQKFNLVDKVPFAPFDQLDIDAAIRQAHTNRTDWRGGTDLCGSRAAQGCHGRPLSDLEDGCGLWPDRRELWDFAWDRGRERYPERAGFQGIRIARRSGTGAVAAGHADGGVERQERAGGFRCAGCIAGYCVGAATGGSGTLQRGPGE